MCFHFCLVNPTAQDVLDHMQTGSVSACVSLCMCQCVSVYVSACPHWMRAGMEREAGKA